VTFGRAGEGGRWSGNIGKAGGDRKRRIQVLMFPSRFEGGLNDDFSDPPLVKEPETEVAPERVGRARLDLHWRQRAVLIKTVDIRVGVLQRGHRADGQQTEVEIVSTTEKGAQLGSCDVPGGEPLEGRAARTVAVVAAIDGSIEIKSVVRPGRVHSPSSAIDIVTATGLERGRGMRILAHHADH
jgi:hypothetical protein